MVRVTGTRTLEPVDGVSEIQNKFEFGGVVRTGQPGALGLGSGGGAQNFPRPIRVVGSGEEKTGASSHRDSLETGREGDLQPCEVARLGADNSRGM